MPLDARTLSRRSWLSIATTGVLFGASPLAGADEPAPWAADHELVDLRVPASGASARRTTVLVPRAREPEVRLPVVVLLHGLGETGNERAGAYAWVERYGLASCASRLLRPPVDSVAKQRYLRPERAAQISDLLAAQRYRGVVMVCPFTPNVYRASSPTAALDRFASWLTEELLPAVRERFPASLDARRTGIDGCSLGGFIAFEAFLRRPDRFYCCGGVQSAIGRGTAPVYAERFAKAIAAQGERRFHLATSRGDPYHDANVALSREMEKRNLPVTLRVAPGPHDQPWLRDVGTLEMLLWHERHLWG